MLGVFNTDGKMLPSKFIIITKVEGNFIHGDMYNFIDYFHNYSFMKFYDELPIDRVIFDKECLLKNLIKVFPEKLASQVKFESSKTQFGGLSQTKENSYQNSRR